MNDHGTSIKITSFCLFLSLLGVTEDLLANDQDRCLFDSLFPKTWYTKATESCAQVWGAFDDLLAHPATSKADRLIIIDAAIGRLVFAQFCLDLITTAQEQSISPDDIAYLVRVIEFVDERYVKLSDTLERDRAYCVRRVINDLQKKIFLLQPKNATLSSYHQESRRPYLIYPEYAINGCECWMVQNIWLYYIPGTYIKRQCA